MFTENHFKTGFFVACCLVSTHCQQRKVDKTEKIVKCGEESQSGPPSFDRGPHGGFDYDDFNDRFSSRKTQKPSETKSDFCVNIPRRENRDRGNRPISEFAWKLFKNSNTPTNYVLSPITPQILLSYLAWIADGNTRNELVSAVGYGDPNTIQRTVDNLLRDGTKRELQLASAFFVSNSIA